MRNSNTPRGMLTVPGMWPALADEYKAGHIPGTVNIPRGVLEFRIYKQLGYPKTVDTKQKIYVHCATGGRATLATKELKDIGFTNVTAVLMNVQDREKE